jgi:two-component sensor histidine kinase
MSATDDLRTASDYIFLRAEPAAASRARAHVARVLGGHGDAELVETAKLIVSELVTNSLQAVDGHAPCELSGQDVSLQVGVYRRRGNVMIEVWDGCASPPVPAPTSPDSENGRGLLLVDTLSTAWGYRWTEPRGKIVWATLVP